MNSVTIVIYARPSISLLKMKGFMRENGRGIYRQLWDETKLLYCQTCARLTFLNPSRYSKHRVDLLLSHVIDIGRMSDLQEVVVSDGTTNIRYRSPQEFCNSECKFFLPEV